MTHSPYTPIDCSDYDYIELACLRQYFVDVETDTGFFTGKALNTKIDDGAEFLTIENSESGMTQIRLDQIKKITVTSTPRDFDEWRFKS